jgi:membrane dipeptidase
MSEWKKLSKNEKDKALEIHDKAIVIDSSICPKQGDDSFFNRANKGGVSAVNSTMIYPIDDFRRSMERIAHQYMWLNTYKDRGFVATTTQDIERAKKEGKVAIIFGPQHTDMIENKLYLLEVFHKLGVRIIQLTYNENNLVGAGCVEKVDPGLSMFGYAVVEEMNKLGILIDLSHCGVNTTNDTIEASKDPVVFTHTGPRDRFEHFRNKYDSQIKAVTETGGITSLTAFRTCIAKEYGVLATFNDLLDCIDWVVDLVGVDHVGFGTDFEEDRVEIGELIWRPDGRPQLMRGVSQEEAIRIYSAGQYTRDEEKEKLSINADIPTIEHFPRLTMGLVHRGYSESDILKVLGGNYMRVFKKVWGE